MSILSLYAKNPKKLIPKKPNFGSILGLFWPQNFKAKLFPKQSFASIILGLYVVVTSSKKSEQFHVMSFDNTRETSFWADFEPLLSQKHQNNVTIQNSLASILSLCASVTSGKKPYKVSFFDY